MKINKKELLIKYKELSRELILGELHEYSEDDLAMLKTKICILEEMILDSVGEATTISAPNMSEGDTVRIVDCGQIYPNFDEFVRRICEENYSEDTGEQIFEIWESGMWEDCLAYKNKIGTVLNLEKHPYKNDILALIAFKNSQGDDVIKLISANGGLELIK